jgi:hypothetical protein
MISYNGNTTNNYINESNRWAINYRYNLAEMKQINIDAKNKLDQLLIDNGISDYKSDMQKAYNSSNYYENMKNKGEIIDYVISISPKAFERFKQSKGSGLIYTTVFTTIGALEGIVESTGEAFSFNLLGEEHVTEAEGDMFLYGAMYYSSLYKLKNQYSDMKNKSINQKDYYYYNAILENIDKEREWALSMVKPIFK